MSFTIAITGKGGVGKTTVAGLLVSRLVASGRAPVLAVDADPNTCLDTVLGIRLKQTIGGVREEARQIAGKGLAAGVSKQELLEIKIAESLVEASDFDFLAMGRPEGPGCYCYANNVLKSALEQIAHHYPWVVIDNEAGLENLSRRLAQKVDVLIMVADPSRRGLETLRRLHALAREMDVRYGRLVLVVNRLRQPSLPPEATAIAAETGAHAVLALPEDNEAADLAERGGTIAELPEQNQLVRRIDGFLADIGRAGPPDSPPTTVPLPKRAALPHDIPSWVSDGAVFFVTINCLQRGANELCIPAIAESLRESIAFHQQLGDWWVHLLVLMPDHLHMLVSFGRDKSMRDVVAKWKEYTANHLDLRWQRDFFDHRLRDDENYIEKANYIRMNPVRKQLCSDTKDWPYTWDFNQMTVGGSGGPTLPRGDASETERQGGATGPRRVQS